MALATKCPHCHTTFRVAHDQLKLRAGLVRCGSCKEIFNGIEHLLRPDEPPVPDMAVAPADALTVFSAVDSPNALPAAAHTEEVPQPAIEAQVAMPAMEADSIEMSIEMPIEVEAAYPIDPAASIESAALANSLDFDVAPPHQDSWSAPPEPVSPVHEDLPLDDPLQRMTLMDFTERPPREEDEEGEAIGIAPADPDAADELEAAIENLQRKPWRDPSKPDDDGDDPEDSIADIPGFVKRGQRQQRLGRSLRMLMMMGSAILLTALLAQSAYVFRNLIAATFPPTKPLLAKACTMLGCQVGLPAQIDAVTIESSELQTVPPGKDRFMLTMLLRNRSATAQAWPNIELTLNDTNERAIGRRVFTPREYLAPAQELANGFAPNSEQPIKIAFELAQLKASGFRVYLFYP